MDATTVVPMSESNLGRLRQMVAVISAFVVSACAGDGGAEVDSANWIESSGADSHEGKADDSSKDGDAGITGPGQPPIPASTETTEHVPRPAGADESTGIDLGQPCDMDERCEAGSRCLMFGVDGGKSRIGICSRECGETGETCGEAALCTRVGDSQLCLGTCDDSINGGLEAYCGSSLACLAVGNQRACTPQCVTDADCSEGACNLASGLCSGVVDTVVVNDIGTACEPEKSNCKSVCLELAEDYAVCSARCTVGNACPDENAVCVNDDAPGQAGIEGRCVELCKQERGCQDPAATCDGFKERNWLATLYNGIYDGLCLRDGEPVQVTASVDTAD